MSGAYLCVQQDRFNLWRWWLEDSAGTVIHRPSESYATRKRALDAAHASGYQFVSRWSR